MSTGNAYVTKKCRICGSFRHSNVLIFEQHGLSEKIGLVYPIILTPNDPLPKGICASCHRNVITLHQNINRTMALQNNWINSLREWKPTHNYIKVIDIIENNNKMTKVAVKKVLADDVHEGAINRQLFTTMATEDLQNEQETDNQPNGGHTNVQNKRRKDPSMEFKPATDISQKKHVIKLPTTTNVTAKVTSPAKRTALDDVPDDVTLNVLKHRLKKNTNAEEPTSSSADKPPEPKIAKLDSSNTSPGKQTKKAGRPAKGLASKQTNNDATYKCTRCSETFDVANQLYEHNLTHMELKLWRLDEKETLAKEHRRGQISVKNADGHVKYIRCSNCLRAFLDKKSIVTHWALKDCEFFCVICRKDFSSAPKMLREHLAKVHDVNYKSIHDCLGQRPKLREIAAVNEAQNNLNASAHKIDTEQQQAMQEIVQPTSIALLKCYICDEVFINDDKIFRAHMQLHNASGTMNSSIADSQLQTNSLDSSHTNNSAQLDHVVKINMHDKTARVVKKPDTSLTASTSNLAIDQPKPVSVALGTTANSSGPNSNRNVIRGVRTKYVQPRTDLQKANLKLTSNAATATTRTAAAQSTSPSYSISNKQYLAPRPPVPAAINQLQQQFGVPPAATPAAVITRLPGSITVRPTSSLLGRPNVPNQRNVVPISISLARSPYVVPSASGVPDSNQRKTTVITTYKTPSTTRTTVQTMPRNVHNLNSSYIVRPSLPAITTSLQGNASQNTVINPPIYSALQQFPPQAQPCHSTIKTEPSDRNTTI